MIDPYRMVATNIVAVLILGILLFFYRFIYPKRKIKPLFLLLLISALPVISIFREGSYESGDLSIHSMFAMSFYKSLIDGELLPRWSGEVFFNYGYPLFLFIYPLPYYISSLLHAIGFSFITSIKLIIAASYILSGLFMYIWIRNKLGIPAAFTASLFYLFSPYHLVDMHFRVAVGEVLSFPLIPLGFLFTEKIVIQPRFRWIMLLTIILFLLILSHQAIFFITAIFLLTYIFFLWLQDKTRSIKSLVFYILPFFLSLLLSTFYWLPMLIESKMYTHLIPHPSIAFPNFLEFIYSPWRWGFLFQGHKGELSFIVGYAQWAIVCISIYLLFSSKGFREKRLLIFFVFSFLIIFTLMQKISKPLWEMIFIMKNFQFSYRLLLPISFITSVLAGMVVMRINKKKFMIIICFLAVSSTILNWGNRRNIPSINDSYLSRSLSNLLGNYGNLGPGIPIWFDNKKLKIDKVPEKPLEVLSGNAKIAVLGRSSIRHEYLIQANENIILRENTLYFPGWKLKINNKIYNFEFDNKEYPGIIIFYLPKGLYKAELVFSATSIRTFSIFVSIFTFVIIIAIMLINLLRKNFYLR